MNYIIYKKGVNPSQIIRTGICPEEMMKIQVKEDEMIIEGIANDSTQYILNGEVINYTPEQLKAKDAVPYGHKWDIATMTAVQTADEIEITNFLSKAARSLRDRLLSGCDWTQTADQPDTTKSKWQQYRQELRDVSSQSGFPKNIIWPIKPS